jgi:hypothetical protein
MRWEIADLCIEAATALYDLRRVDGRKCLLKAASNGAGLPMVRCLEPFEYELRLESVLRLALEGEDAVTLVDESVDLTPHIREDSLLALPAPIVQAGCRVGPACGTGCKARGVGQARGFLLRGAFSITSSIDFWNSQA